MRKLITEELKCLCPIAYEFVCKNDLISIEEKRYSLTDDIYVNVESYNTFDFQERKYESHRNYADIQYIIRGTENIIVEYVGNLTISDDYDENRDITFYDNNYHGMDNILIAGEMILLEPKDGHMPCVKVDKSIHVKKAVFKIPIGKVGRII